MSKQIEKSLFMFSSLAVSRFYQELLRGVANYHQLSNKLIQLAEQARALRQFDRVREIGRILSNIPTRDIQSIGQYYLAVAYNNCGNGELDKAQELFTLAADTAPPKYGAKAILSLAAVSAHRKDFDGELYYFAESVKASQDIGTSLIALRGIAVHKAKEGYHTDAVKELEQIMPMMKFAPQYVRLDYLNSLAVELGETGRKDEARDIMRVVLASPFTAAYPEWQQTATELRQANRSFAVVPRTKVEQVETKAPAIETSQPKAVISFPKLKEAPPPEKPEKITPIELKQMTADEKRDMIIAALRSDTIEASDYDKIIFMFGLLKSGPAGNILDLEDESVLEDLIIIWAAHIGSEQLAAVMSALRDCEDDIRRANLIDRIIRKAFEESMTCDLTEEQWRLKVESRLPEKY